MNNNLPWCHLMIVSKCFNYFFLFQYLIYCYFLLKIYSHYYNILSCDSWDDFRQNKKWFRHREVATSKLGKHNQVKGCISPRPKASVLFHPSGCGLMFDEVKSSVLLPHTDNKTKAQIKHRSLSFIWLTGIWQAASYTHLFPDRSHSGPPSPELKLLPRPQAQQ